jgi:hypothetical protein
VTFDRCYAFNIAVTLNLLCLFMYQYPAADAVLNRTNSESWDYQGLSPVNQLVTAEGAGALQPLAMVLAILLVPLYALAIAEHALYVLPVKMHGRYLALETTPPFSFLRGQVCSTTAQIVTPPRVTIRNPFLVSRHSASCNQIARDRDPTWRRIQQSKWHGS